MTTYDIMCSELQKQFSNAVKDKEEAYIKRTVFSHYYSAFKTENRKRSNTHKDLVNALEVAGEFYTPFHHVRSRIHSV